MAKDIDKLFRDQLQNRSFEWKEAYWEGAEAVIAAAERRRRRRFFFFWLSGATVVLAGVALWWFFGQKPARMAGQLPLEKKEVAVPQKEEAALPAERPIATNAAEADSRPNLHAETVNTWQDVNPPIVETEKETKAETFEAHSILAENTREVDLPDVMSLQSSEEEELQPLIEKTETRVKGTSILTALPGIPFYALSNPELPFGIALVLEENTPIETTDRSFSWRGGVGIGAQVDGLPSNALPGAWVGVVFQGKLRDKWGWTAGLNYAMYQLMPEELERTEQTLMSFGATKTVYVSEARSAHRIAAPIGVIYRLGRRVTLEAGAHLSYSLAVRGVTKEVTHPQPWERSSDERGEYEPRLSAYYDDQSAGGDPEFPLLERSDILSRDWFSAKPDDVFQIQPFVGVQYNVGTRFTFTGRVAYPGTISAGAFYWFR